MSLSQEKQISKLLKQTHICFFYLSIACYLSSNYNGVRERKNKNAKKIKNISVNLYLNKMLLIFFAN